MKLIATTILLIFAATGVACAGTASSGETPVTPPITETAEAPPDTTKTGIAAIDQVLEAVESGDSDALIAQAKISIQKCTHAQGAGGPPKCRPSEAEGTSVEVMFASSCEGFYLRHDDLDSTAARFLEGTPKVHSVYPHNGLLFPSSQYIVLLSATPNEGIPATLGRELFVSDNGIVGLNFGCGESPRDMISMQSLGEPIFSTGSSR